MNKRAIFAIFLCIVSVFTLTFRADEQRPYLIPVYKALLLKNPLRLVRNFVHAYEVTSFTGAISYIVETYKKAYLTFGPQYFDKLVRSGDLDMLLDPEIFKQATEFYKKSPSMFEMAAEGDLERWLRYWRDLPEIVQKALSNPEINQGISHARAEG